MLVPNYFSGFIDIKCVTLDFRIPRENLVLHFQYGWRGGLSFGGRGKAPLARRRHSPSMKQTRHTQSGFY